MIVEEIEEGEIVDNEHEGSKTESKDELPSNKKTPIKKKNRRTGEELEEGEILSSDDEVSPSSKKLETKNTLNAPAVSNIKEKRGAENKENRVDKKKKGIIKATS